MSIIKTSNFLSPRPGLSRNPSEPPPNLLASGIMEKKDKTDKPQNSQAKGYTEKITALKFILFVIYVISFLLVINIHFNFPQKFNINTAIYQFFLNQIEDFDTYPEITVDKMRFYDISSATNITSWIKQNVINGLYSNINGGLITDSNKENKIMYPPITPLRIVQKRAKIKYKPSNENFPMSWDLNAQSDNTTTYGSINTNITYSDSNDGFNITIPVSVLELDEAEQMFDNATENGYFDSQTRDITVDFTVFDTRLELATYFQAEFQFSPSGRIGKLNHEIVSFPVRFYTDTKGRATIFFQILFVALLFYYAYNELNNVKNHISSMFYERLKADQGHGAVQKIQLEASKCKDRAKLTIKGIANHLLDPWHFFNTLIIVCSSAIVIIWLTIVAKNRLYHLLQAYQSPTENIDVIYSSNDEMQTLKKQTVRVLQFAAINILIMMVKFVQYLSFLSMRMKALSQIIGEITAQLTYFFIVLGVILVSFTYMIYNFFGDSIEEFKNPLKIFRYLITGLNFDYSQIDNMFKFDRNATIIFHILFILIVIFILSNLFSVYVIRGVDEYMKQRRIAQKASQDIKRNPFNFRPHPVWRFKNFLTQKLPLFLYSLSSKEKAVQERQKIDKENKNLEKQLKNHRHLHFDIDVEDSTQSMTKFDPFFNNEASILKHKQNQKVKAVRIIWSVVAVWISFVFLQIIATNHHKITEGSNIKSTLKFMFEQTNIKQQRADGQVGNFSSDISISNLRNPHDIVNWVTSLFVNYASENSYTLSDKGEYAGYYVQDTNFLISDQYRLSIRKRTLEQVESDTYNGYSNFVFTDIFQADAKNPKGESTSQVQGSSTGTLYNFTESSGYHNAGGYILTSSIADFSDLFANIKSDRFINSTINSIVIDFPLLNINTEDVIYIALIFELQDGFNIKTTMSIDYIGLAFYDTAGGVFIAILEILTILWFILFSRQLYRRLKISNEHYDFWYATHIFHLPQVVKDQREKKNPEYLRKFAYVVGFSNFLNILILICYFLSMIFWVRNLIGVTIINKNIDKFHNDDPEADNDQLLSSITTLIPWFDASKFLESFVLFLTTIKLLYYYSNFSPFQFLTLTIRKSLEWICFMFIILIIYVIGFGLFMQMVKGNQTETYSQFFQLLVEQMQAVNMMIVGEKQFISENYGTFITLIFYIPWVMFVTYIVAGMFNGIVYNSYRAAIKHQQEMELYKTNLSIQDFFTITIERLKRKKSKDTQQKTAHFEINDQLRNKFNSQQVFNEFDRAINLAYDIRDPKTWAANCINIIKSENEHRKNMKTTSKEILKASVVDFDQEKHTHKKIMNDKEKLSHFELRLQYWNYFKSGNDMLLQHMHSLNQGINLLEEKVNDPETKALQRNADNKINKYILELEAKISQNLSDIQNMKRTLDQYQSQS